MTPTTAGQLLDVPRALLPVAEKRATLEKLREQLQKLAGRK